jgi:predicted dehydrogenase
MAFHVERLKKAGAPIPSTYPAEQFDRMIRETKADVVIVTSVDSTHHTYIVRAMELECDVICEKPMTVDAPKARAILDAVRRTGRSLRVTFNMRYISQMTKVRELMRSGAIGKPLFVNLSWLLDVYHGADYFRRWHREKSCSGGLLVHKSTHHFDLVNWWIDSYPRTVVAMGDLKFYGRGNAVARGESRRTSYDRYASQPATETDPFSLRLDADPELKGLYLDAEADSGYIRDRNVFGDNISAEDSMAVMVRYRNEVLLSYSLLCYSPWEGWDAAITGGRGRIEITARYATHVPAGSEQIDSSTGGVGKDYHKIKVFPTFGAPYEVPLDDATGAHGGDELMLEQIFSADGGMGDPFGRAANYMDGAASILVGISANVSMETGLPVNCDDLIRL